MRGKVVKQLRKMADVMAKNKNDFDVKVVTKMYSGMFGTEHVDNMPITVNVRTLKKDSQKYLANQLKIWWNSYPTGKRSLNRLVNG